MQLNSDLLTILRVEAACQTSEVAKDLQHTEALAYARGVQDGQTLLARRVLEALTIRRPRAAEDAALGVRLPQTPEEASGCIQHAHPGSCRCANCYVDPFQVDRRHD